MTPQAKIAKIIETIESGKTVYISTALRVTPVTSKTLAKFRAAGYELFNADSKSTYMLSGKKYVCIDYCRITFSD